MGISTQRSSRFAWGIMGLFALVALAAPLMANPSGEVKAAEDELKKAVNSGDQDGTEKAIAKLKEIGGADAAKSFLSLALRVPAGNEGIYWRLVDGAATLRDEGGLKEVAKTILEQKGGAISRDLMFALGNNRSPKVATCVYETVLEKGSDEFRLMAADNLCGIEAVEAVDVMIAVYKKDEKKKDEVTARILAGLKWLTGADCGNAAAWDAWWKGTGRAAGLKGRERREENTGTVVDEVEGPRWHDTQSLEKIKPERIVVLVADCPKSKDKKGTHCNFDDMDKILKEMKIPHIVVTKTEFEGPKANCLDKAMALLLTCTQINQHCVCPNCVTGKEGVGNRMVACQCKGCPGPQVNHKLTGGSVKKIKEWVERGGYLFSEDWGIKDALEPAWPSLVKEGKMMKERTVGCCPSRGRTSHPLLRGVFIDPAAKEPPKPEGGDGGEGGGTVTRDPPPDSTPSSRIQRNWKIDADSPYISIVNKGAVFTLMESDELGKEGNPAVAITFLPAGAASEQNAANGKPEKLVGGRVLHVLSHFGKQHERKDEFALQNLLLNFLMEANRRYKKSA